MTMWIKQNDEIVLKFVKMNQNLLASPDKKRFSANFTARNRSVFIVDSYI